MRLSPSPEQRGATDEDGRWEGGEAGTVRPRGPSSFVRSRDTWSENMYAAHLKGERQKLTIRSNMPKTKRTGCESASVFKC